jgi:RNA polymerase sigma factor (sigma-70 family)
MYQIGNLIKKQSLNYEQREKVNYVLYKSYEKLAIKKATDFKKVHKFTCKNINIDELILSSKIGLFKSIKNYNGNSSFIYFSDFYIKGELFKLVTSHYYFSGIPKSIRMKSKKNYSEDSLSEYKQNLQPILTNDFENTPSLNQVTILDKLNADETKMGIWEYIYNLDPFYKRIMYLKYDAEFNKIRSNKIIAELMCCSEENVRKTLHETLKKIRQQTTKRVNI